MLITAETDFRLGWRCLLPEAKTGLAVLGLDAVETEFLASELALGSVRVLPSDFSLGELDSSPLVLIVADRAVCKRAAAVLKRGFYSVREYGLLPAMKPRVVVSLHCSLAALAGLSLHRPGRFIAQLGVWVANALARLGDFSLLRDRVLLIASRTGDLFPHALKRYGLFDEGAEIIEYALYLGTPDNNRKTVILPIQNGETEFILKIGQWPKARAALACEALALRVLGQSSVMDCVPALKAFFDDEGAVTLCQEYRQRKWASSNRLRKEAALFLLQLAKIECRTISLSEMLARLPRRWGDLASDVQQAFELIWDKLQTRAEAGLCVLLHRGHGDFAPWNCAWTVKGFFVYDWEESRPDTPAFEDAFYYVLAPYAYVRKNPDPQLAYRDAMRWVQELNYSINVPETELPMYLALSLLAKSDRHPVFGQVAQFLARDFK